MPPTLPASRARILALSAAGWTLLATARASARAAVVPRAPADVAVLIGLSIVVTLPWMLATPWIIELAERLARRPGRIRMLLGHALALLVCTVADAAWSFAVIRWSGTPITVGPALWYLGRLDQTLFLYLCLVAIGSAMRHRVRLDAARVRQASLAARLLHARLHALSLQLHPHFLYNTLNAVSELVHRDAAAARATLASLADLLRRTLDTGESQEHALREEIGLLEPYVRIQRTRFTGLTLRTEVEPAALDAAVPRLVLQPLVENAIRHGISRRAGPGTVTVRAHAAGGRLVMEVEDDGVGAKAERELREGIGLGNTRARLRELHGADARLTLSPGAERGMVARVECPLRLAAPLAPGQAADPDIDERGDGRRADARRFALLLAGAWLAVVLLGAHEDYLAGFLFRAPEPFLAVLLPRLGEGAIWLALAPAILWLARRLALASPGWIGLAAGHLAGAAAICSAHLALTLRLVSPDLTPNLIASVLVVDLALYAALAAAAHAWTIHRAAAECRAEAARLDGELAAARLDLVRWRLRPELLFRALDAIADRAATAPAEADELTGRLGELLRLMLPTGPDSAVPLRAEIEFLTAYLEVSSAVGLGAPRLSASLAAEAEAVLVPAMLLQSLVELTGGGPGDTVSVEAGFRADALLVQVRSDGSWAADPARVELEARRRLVHHFGHDCELRVDHAGGSTAVTVAIPTAGTARAVA